MKKIILLSVVMLSLWQLPASAHSGGHEQVNDVAAIKLAQQAAKMLTLEGYQMSVGKIDLSWAKLALSNFTVVRAERDSFVIRGTNSKLNQTFNFVITKQGRIQDVVDVSKQSQESHDHRH